VIGPGLASNELRYVPVDVVGKSASLLCDHLYLFNPALSSSPKSRRVVSSLRRVIRGRDFDVRHIVDRLILITLILRLPRTWWHPDRTREYHPEPWRVVVDCRKAGGRRALPSPFSRHPAWDRRWRTPSKTSRRRRTHAFPGARLLFDQILNRVDQKFFPITVWPIFLSGI